MVAGLLALLVGMPSSAPAAESPAHVAATLLAAAPLPPGATAFGGVLPAPLAIPAATPAGNHLLDIYRIWAVPELPGGVPAWASAVPPGGMVATGSGSAYQAGELQVRFVTWSMPTPPPGMWVAQVLYAVAPLPGGGGSLIRVDAQVGSEPRGPSTHRSPVSP